MAWGKRIMAAGKLDVGGIEYLEAGGPAHPLRHQANSNLRPSIGQAFGFDPFERVVDFLLTEMRARPKFYPRATIPAA